MLGSHPPQASEDSFSDDDELIGLEDQLNEMEDDKSGLPRHIMERFEKRQTKERRKAERQARSNRARKAQEIQRELEELEVECQGVEERGVQLEQLLREEEGGEAMAEWYRLLGQKNRLVRKEQELMVASKQLRVRSTGGDVTSYGRRASAPRLGAGDPREEGERLPRFSSPNFSQDEVE